MEEEHVQGKGQVGKNHVGKSQVGKRQYQSQSLGKKKSQLYVGTVLNVKKRVYE